MHCRKAFRLTFKIITREVDSFQLLTVRMGCLGSTLGHFTTSYRGQKKRGTGYLYSKGHSVIGMAGFSV